MVAAGFTRRSRVFPALSAFVLSACAGGELDLPPPGVLADGRVVWLWYGPPEKVPSCPHGGPPLWDARDVDVAIPEVCGTCTCGPAACVLPRRVLTHATNRCDGGAPLPFDGEKDWNGSCYTSPAPVPADAFASVTYEPPTLVPCTPSPTPRLPPLLGKFARACAPGVAGDSGFDVCIDPEPDGSCDRGFPARYELTELADNRTCTPCACAASEQNCTVEISLYSAAGCIGRLDSVTISHISEPACQDVPLGPLAAIDADWTIVQPGTCTPTTVFSTVAGTAVRTGSHVLCCKNEANDQDER